MRNQRLHYGVFIGRFNPIHNGHVHVIRTALEQVETLILLVGSSNRARSPRNPFTYIDREHMLRTIFRHEIAEGRIEIRPLPDRMYNDDAWTQQVQQIVWSVVDQRVNPNQHVTLHGKKDFHIGLVGFQKDGSSYYLRKFPEWSDGVNIESQFATFNSSDIRNTYLQRNPLLPSSVVVPEEIMDDLRWFVYTENFKWLVAEADFYRDYRSKMTGKTPYPIMIQTVDPVVVQSGHILLVKRAFSPGKGLLALPGGHPEMDETLEDAVCRELREETQIRDKQGKIPQKALKKFINRSNIRTFDDPYRSERGRVITTAYEFRLPDETDLYQVLGDDDAEMAGWYPIGSLRTRDFFEDHAFIIENMLSVKLNDD